MKMVKKILLGLAASALLIGLMGCSADVEDEEETSKWEKTVKVDATKLPDGFARVFEN